MAVNRTSNFLKFWRVRNTNDKYLRSTLEKVHCHHLRRRRRRRLHKVRVPTSEFIRNQRRRSNSSQKKMAGRNRGPPHPHPGHPPPIHEHPFGRGLGPMPHPALLEEMRDVQFGRGPRPLLPHPAMLEERLAAQHQEIQGLLVDNQRLAATHVALKQELTAAQHEIQRMAHIAGSMNSGKDIQLREVYERSMKMEADLHAAEGMRNELMKARTDVQNLSASRQELNNQIQALTQELNRAKADLQQMPALKAEIENMKQELQRARAAIEYEQKGHADNYEHGQAMEQNLIGMAREVEKLRAEIANAEKRARAAAAVAVGNTGGGYSGNYGNPDTGYGGNPYPNTYGVNPGQVGAEGTQQYGPGPGAWGAYDMQRAHGRR